MNERKPAENYNKLKLKNTHTHFVIQLQENMLVFLLNGGAIKI